MLLMRIVLKMAAKILELRRHNFILIKFIDKFADGIVLASKCIFQRMTTDAVARQQHLTFQTYLMNEKVNVTKNWGSKIFPSTSYEDYEIINELGQGSFGQVVAARNRQSEKVLAIKIIPKRNLVNSDQLRHLKSEIRVLHSVSFQFLISLECYFTNKCFVFIVLPYIDGGHFFKILRSVRTFDEDSARFFAGQIVLAIEYLHYMGIVYRDLKPENLLLDLQGYLKIVDYGFARRIGNSHAYTFCGTPEYIAPEILLSKGYTLSPDWWTLGILLYEMCCGTPPFMSKNTLKLYETILVGKINWPQHFSHDLRSIVQGLLQVDKSKRLGCMKNKSQDIKFHKWFSSLDWNALWNKKILSPIKPRKNDKLFERNHSTSLNLSFTSCKHFIPSEMIGNIDFAIYVSLLTSCAFIKTTSSLLFFTISFETLTVDIVTRVILSLSSSKSKEMK